MPADARCGCDVWVLLLNRYTNTRCLRQRQQQCSTFHVGLATLVVKLTSLAVKHNIADKNSAHSERFIAQQAPGLELLLPKYCQQYGANPAAAAGLRGWPRGRILSCIVLVACTNRGAGTKRLSANCQCFLFLRPDLLRRNEAETPLRSSTVSYRASQNRNKHGYLSRWANILVSFFLGEAHSTGFTNRRSLEVDVLDAAHSSMP